MAISNPWGKFFWNDWENDPAIRLSSLAAQGLWMRMLCMMAKGEPTGFLTLAGRNLNMNDLSTLTGRSIEDLAPLMTELEQNGVFSRDAKQRIYSRRMVRDIRNSAHAKKNGKLGGNPSLSIEKENTGQLNHQDKPPDKPQSHKPIAITTSQLAAGRKNMDLKNAPFQPPTHDNEVLPNAWQDYAEIKNIPNEQIFKSWRKFKDVSSYPYEAGRWKAWVDREKIERAA